MVDSEHVVGRLASVVTAAEQLHGMARSYVRKVGASALLAATGTATWFCSDPASRTKDDSRRPVGTNSAALDDSPAYRHPLQGVALVNGRVPGVDIHDSPTGKRYAIEYGGHQDSETEPEVVFSAVVELDQSTISAQEWLDIRKSDGTQPRGESRRGGPRR